MGRRGSGGDRVGALGGRAPYLYRRAAAAAAPAAPPRAQRRDGPAHALPRPRTRDLPKTWRESRTAVRLPISPPPSSPQALCDLVGL